MATLKIDPEFAPYLGGVSEFADAELERQLVENGGPDEPICVWKGHGIIIGGHRRYKFCQMHSLPFKVREVELADREAVKEWMDRDQFCRRNVPSAIEAAHTARMVEKKIAAGASRCDARAEVASELGISERQVWRRTASDKQRVADMENVIPEVREKIVSGEVMLNCKALHSLAELPEEKQSHAYSEFEQGKFKSLQECLLGERKAPEKKQGPAKPRVDCFRDLIKAVGVLKKTVDEVHANWPFSDRKAIMGAIDAIGEMVVEWRKAG